ncbi:MAG: hypothetical protein PHC28_15160 [Flavobacterium sp.]|uniref:hypothetical protein n=1 Tax=Flavobacterium sp. TaxID=239 RepID=UPI0026363440|nr:hypothetical protein [Flavobacterium sp.]MDD5151793.1 hypothetical protein [Flavobacterium sp.]
MNEILLTKINELYIKIDSDRGIIQELSEKFSFYVEGYKFMPKYKMGIWDGKIKLFDVNTRLFPFGLLFELLKFCKNNDYSVKLTNKDKFKRENFDDELLSFTDNISNITNKKVDGMYSYQYDAFRACIQNNKALVLSPTSCLDPKTKISVYLSKEAKDFLYSIRT